MLKICLSRTGKTKQPTYRVIVLEKTKDPWGDYLELLGTYNPRTKPSTIQLKADRIQYWISKGAQPSPTVHNLLVDQKIIDKPKVVASSGRKRGKKDGGDTKPAATKPVAAVKDEQKSATIKTPVDNTDDKKPDDKLVEEKPKDEDKKEDQAAK